MMTLKSLIDTHLAYQNSVTTHQGSRVVNLHGRRCIAEVSVNQDHGLNVVKVKVAFGLAHLANSIGYEVLKELGWRPDGGGSSGCNGHAWTVSPETGNGRLTVVLSAHPTFKV